MIFSFKNVASVTAATSHFHCLPQEKQLTKDPCSNFFFLIPNSFFTSVAVHCDCKQEQTSIICNGSVQNKHCKNNYVLQKHCRNDSVTLYKL